MVESAYVFYQWSLIAREFGSMYALCVFGLLYVGIVALLVFRCMMCVRDHVLAVCVRTGVAVFVWCLLCVG